MSEAAAAKADNEPLVIGRYALFDAVASGGMATVHLGRLLGPVGFGRTVAVKRLHSHYTTDQDFVTMFMDEARIVARIRHPNVVPMIDIIESSKGLFLIMEYVHGESYSKLLRTTRHTATKEDIPIKLANAVMHGVLLGLHAAHETKGVKGEVLDVVHRDVSPQNIIVGADGVARVLDFGVAKAAGRAQVTREGQIKGKLAYMAPEQIRGKVDRRADVFAAAVVLWESIAGRRLHEGAKDVEIVTRVVQGKFPKPSEFRADVPPELDAIIMKGLEIDPEQRYQNARDMALELERKVGLAPPSEIGEWVERLAADVLRVRADKVSAMEKASADLSPIESVPPPPPPGGSSGGSDPAVPASSPSGHGGAGSEPRASVPGKQRSGEYTAVMAPIPGVTHTPLPIPAPSIQPASSSEPSLPSIASGVSAGDGTGTGTGTDTRSRTPAGLDLPLNVGMQRQRDLAPLIAIGSFLGALALVGAALGGWSLYARSTTPASSSTPPPLASTVIPSPPASASPTASSPPSPVPSSSHEGSIKPRPTSPGGGTGAATTSDAGSAATTASPIAHPTFRPQPAPAPAKKPNCDPPYTVDENGHRKYKMECLGTD